MDNELESMGIKQPQSNLISFQGLTWTTAILSQDSWCPDGIQSHHHLNRDLYHYTVSQLDQPEFVLGGRNICYNVSRDTEGMHGHLSVHLWPRISEIIITEILMKFPVSNFHQNLIISTNHVPLFGAHNKILLYSE